MSPVNRRDVEIVCSKVAHRIKKDVPPGVGFVLIISSFGDAGFTAYMSSQHRGDTINLLHELVDQLEEDEKDI